MNSFKRTVCSLSSLLSVFPNEILYDIILQINDPKTFKSISQTCKLLNQICLDPKIQTKFKEKFKIKKITRTSVFKEECFILPNGTKYGENKEWYDTGQLWVHCYYKDDKVSGKYKVWYDNGQLLRQCTYLDSKLEGEYKVWHENGQLFRCCFYVNDKKEGEFKEWYMNGQLSEHSYFKKDKLDGEFKKWFENEQLSEHSFYKDGIRVGEWIEWNQNGQLQRHRLYKSVGNKGSKCKRWDSKGQLKELYFYKFHKIYNCIKT